MKPLGRFVWLLITLGLILSGTLLADANANKAEVSFLDPNDPNRFICTFKCSDPSKGIASTLVSTIQECESACASYCGAPCDVVPAPIDSNPTTGPGPGH